MTIRNLIHKINTEIYMKGMEGKFLNSEEVCSMAENFVNRYLEEEGPNPFLYADIEGR